MIKFEKMQYNAPMRAYQVLGDESQPIGNLERMSGGTWQFRPSIPDVPIKLHALKKIVEFAEMCDNREGD